MTMGDTIIRWATKTWNPLVGCSRVSPGCAHCYAKALHDMRHRAFHEGKDVPEQYALPFETVQLKPERLDYPRHWRKPAKIFVNSVSDLFHEDVPFDFIDRVFAVMALCPQHVFQVLTKRPERMLEYCRRIEADDFSIVDEMQTVDRRPALWWDLRNKSVDLELDADGGIDGVKLLWPLPNVWLGTSVENQHWADIRIPLLMQTPAAVRFLSCEPLLGPVDLRRVEIAGRAITHPLLVPEGNYSVGLVGPISWVIVGGESGKKRRAMDVQWARELRDQCQEAGVAFFFKQMGGARSETGKELDGATWEQFPEVAA
jgi:protein gp37